MIKDSKIKLVLSICDDIIAEMEHLKELCLNQQALVDLSDIGKLCWFCCW